jgi:hypothetical protein
MKIKATKLVTTASTSLLAAVLASTLSFTAYADSDTDTNHSTMHNTGMKMGGDMQAMRAKMQAEMQAIINTDDKAKRQAMFTAHKEKMKGMMGMMQGNCNGMKGGKSAMDHQGETD